MQASDLLHLPRRGQLLTECAALDGSGTPQCFVRGLSTVQECTAAHGPAITDPLPALFSAGQAGDGGLGAICAPPPVPGKPFLRGARAQVLSHPASAVFSVYVLIVAPPVCHACL